jgi:hypothetical protein
MAHNLHNLRDGVKRHAPPYATMCRVVAFLSSKFLLVLVLSAVCGLRSGSTIRVSYTLYAIQDIIALVRLWLNGQMG